MVTITQTLDEVIACVESECENVDRGEVEKAYNIIKANPDEFYASSRPLFVSETLHNGACPLGSNSGKLIKLIVEAKGISNNKSAVMTYVRRIGEQIRKTLCCTCPYVNCFKKHPGNENYQGLVESQNSSSEINHQYL